MREYARYEEPTWQARKQRNQDGIGTAVAWLLVGIGIGAGLALLLTPASGRELRSAVARGYRHAMDGIARSTQDLRRRGSNLLTFNRRRPTKQRLQQR